MCDKAKEYWEQIHLLIQILKMDLHWKPEGFLKKYYWRNKCGGNGILLSYTFSVL